MNPREAGFLLLTSHLGDPESPVLSPARLRTLTHRMTQMQPPREDRMLLPEDLTALGYDREFARRVLSLLHRQEQLQWYLQLGAKCGCVPLTRVSSSYPPALRKRLGEESPGCLWAKGDVSLLCRPCISLVGSRSLNPPNRAFAAEAGRQAALQGYVLVSGGARGADRTAQEACLAAGGAVICVVPDRLDVLPVQERILYLSEDGFDITFSSVRALSRNHVIHALGDPVLVAQCTLGTGGTWSGTAFNLKRGITSVFCFQDGSEAASELIAMGAVPIKCEDLQDFSQLQPLEIPFL